MKVQVLQKDLSKALVTALRFINIRSSLPVLSNFKLEATKTKLKISATNLEMSINISVGAKIEKEGIVTVPAKIFSEIVSNLGGDQISIESIKEELIITSSHFSGNLTTIPSNDFPSIPETLNKDKAFTIERNVLANTLAKVLFSASSDETRPILGGVLFIFQNDALDLVASDGFRLSKKKIKLTKKIEAKQIVIPKPSLMEMIKISEGTDSIWFELKEGDNQLIIQIGDVCLSTRLIDGNFPDFEKIIPKVTNTKVLVDKNDLLKAVSLASIFAKLENDIVKLKIKNDSIEVDSQSAKAGKQTNVVEAKVEGSASAENPLSILYNYKFIIDFINVVAGEGVEINLVDGSSAAIFADPVDTDFLHLIMPVRIQS